MPVEDWIPIEQLRLTVRHFVAVVAIGLAVGGAGRAFGIVVPGMAQNAELIEGFMLYGLLAIMAVKLIWEFLRLNGAAHAFATA